MIPTGNPAADPIPEQEDKTMATQLAKRFYLDKRNGMLAGVCSGIADYTGLGRDPASALRRCWERSSPGAG